MITIQSESFAGFYNDAKEMIAAHWEEAASLKDVRKLNVEVEKFLKADSLGVLIVITARDNWRLVGYNIGHILAPQHTGGIKIAEQAYYYVDQDYRGNGVFKSLCEKFEAEGKKRGAVACGARQKLDEQGNGSVSDGFFKDLGYHKNEIVWAKRL